MIGLASLSLGRTDGPPPALLGRHPQKEQAPSQPLELGSDTPRSAPTEPTGNGRRSPEPRWGVRQPRPRALPSLSRPSPAAGAATKSGSDGPQRATGDCGGLTWHWGVRGEGFRVARTGTTHPSTEGSGRTLRRGKGGKRHGAPERAEEPSGQGRCQGPGRGARVGRAGCCCQRLS